MAGIAKSGNELHSEAEGRPKGDGVSRAGESFPPCPWGQPRSGGGGRGKAPATKRKKAAMKGCRRFRLVGYGVEKSKYLLKSFEEIDEFWEYWQRHGRGTILTLLSLCPFLFFLEIIHLT